MSKITSVHTSISENKYRSKITAGVHMLIADEPVNEGGLDLGPTPIQLLAGSLGSCTTITLRMYADRKGWPLQGADVNVTIDRTTTQASIQRNIRLHGPLDETQRARLMQVADACPVHKMLSATIAITTVEQF
ncbi:MAG: OsmC family protein [Chloroflexi bacterium]|jgi:putative redox protein|nr:OsmC family protein [Chloroflexota bacterium]